MPRYVAFLRAVNVGGRTIRMERLRAIFEALGFSRVETFIASGNVIFDTRATNRAAIETKIAKGLEKALGYPVASFVRSLDEVCAIAAHQPFAAAAQPLAGHVYVIFLADTPTADARAVLSSLRSEMDDFELGEREVFWWCRGNLLDSPLSGAQLERRFGQGTMRNRNTVVRLAAKCATPSTGRR